MNRNCYEEAANWWTSQIVGSKDFEFTDSNIQTGFEMKIIFSNIFIYNYTGALVAYF